MNLTGFDTETSRRTSPHDTAEVEDPFAPERRKGELGELARRLFADYRLFLPGILATLSCAVIDEPLHALLVGLVASPFFLAGAAASLGHVQESALRAAIERAGSHLLNLGILLGAGFLAAWPGMLFTAGLAEDHPGVPDVIVALTFFATSGIPVLLLLSRLWPLATVSFTCAEHETTRTRRFAWVGPGLLTAWRLTGVTGAALEFALPLLKDGTLLFGSYAAASLLLGSWDAFAWLLNATFYLFLLPLWSLVLVRRGARLHDRWRNPPPAGGESPQPVTETAWMARPWAGSPSVAPVAHSPIRSAPHTARTGRKAPVDLTSAEPPSSPAGPIALTELERPCAGESRDVDRPPVAPLPFDRHRSQDGGRVGSA